MTKTVPSTYVENDNKGNNFILKVLEDVLLYSKWEDRESVVEFMNKLVDDAMTIEGFPDGLKQAFSECGRKLNDLSFEDMKEIIAILNENDEE